MKPTLTATPNNSNIFSATISGFGALSNVTLQLMNGNTTVYTFPGTMQTDANGSFSSIMIVPTSIQGAVYNLTTTIAGTTLSVSYLVPNLIGATGATGAPGESANNNLGYAAIIISALALIVAVIAAFLRKKT